MFRPLVAALTFASFAAFAQSTEEPAPPLVPADQPQPPPMPPPEPLPQQQYQQQKLKRQQQPVPYQQQPQQPAPQYQQPQPYQQQPQYQQPQPYQQQPQPYPAQQPEQYQQQPQPYPAQQPQQYQQQPQPYPAQQPPPPQYVPQTRRPKAPPPPKKDPAEGFHMKLLLSGNVGIFSNETGFTGGIRGEFDVSRIAIYGAYNRFLTTDGRGDAHQFTLMGGYSLMANRVGRFRVLGGLDLIGTPSTVAFGPIVGLDMRLGLGFIGFDAASFLTFYPYRQLELRAAVVLRFWVLELHAGWRFQVMDAVQPAEGGSFGSTFLTAPTINGPYLAVGLAF